MKVDWRKRWEATANVYADEIGGGYHRHRIDVVRALEGVRLLDFGCGDGTFMLEACRLGAASVTGIDQSSPMLARASEKVPNCETILGGTETLARLGDSEVGCVLALNVLAYLSSEEESAFYAQTQRILHPGGSLVIIHSNALFDLFTLNRFTVEFHRQHFGTDPTTLLTSPSVPDRRQLLIRENPLSYALKLERLGFRQVRQEFMNFHAEIPLLSVDDPDDMQRERPDTLNWPPEDRWRLMFQCSMFGVRAIAI